MPKKTRVIEREELIDEAAEEALANREAETLIQKQDEIEEWVSEFQSKFAEQDVKVQVDKYSEGSWEICRKYPLGSFDHELVRDEFGGGRYRATLFGTDGKYVKGGRHEFKFATPLKPLKDLETQNKNPLADPVVMMMMENMKANQAMMLEIVKSTLAGSASKGNELSMVVETMKAVGAITPKDSGLKQIQEAMQLAASMRDMMSPEKEESSGNGSFMGEIKDFFTLLPAIREQIGTMPRPDKIQTQPLAIQNPPVSIPEKRKKPMLNPVQHKIVELVPKFVEAAEAGAPIESWSEYLANVLELEIMPLLVPHIQKQFPLVTVDEDMVYDGLLKRAKDPAEREKIFVQIPPLAKYQEWVNKVIDATIPAFEDDPADVPTDATIPLDAAGDEGSTEE